MLIDSHCHLDRIDLEPFGGSMDNVLATARDNGIGGFLCVCIDTEHFADVRDIADGREDVWCSVGVHPDSQDVHDPDVDELCLLAADPNVIAIGETGLDYFRLKGDLEWQRERFRTHIRAAKKTGKPLIIHTRAAREDTIRLLREEGAETVGGVMHCFSEDWETARQAMDLDFYISFSGIVTFKNAEELREVVRQVPLDRLLVETDSPYLAPVPHRGKGNHPAWVRHVAERVAEVKGVPVEEIEQATTQNFRTLFRAG
ncbi:MAG TPA: TatD family deoxyribonuclease [Thioalkalivibrio sp.]|nr:TatD family deoxyribonuclease [Thioalkalivibrio sp.]